MFERLFAYLFLVAFAVSMLLHKPLPLAIGP
jgi:hypothetical protein